MRSEEPSANWTSVTLLERVREGDDQAAAELFSRYVERLTRLARVRLSARVATRTDPDDVVMSVFRSFFIAAREGRFLLTRGGDLWRLLASITQHKVLRHVRQHTADRRSVDCERSLDQVNEGDPSFWKREPSVEEALALADELERLLNHLTPFARRVVELRLQGLQLAQIAETLECSERTVRRSLDQAKQILTERLGGA